MLYVRILYFLDTFFLVRVTLVLLFGGDIVGAFFLVRATLALMRPYCGPRSDRERKRERENLNVNGNVNVDVM